MDNCSCLPVFPDVLPVALNNGYSFSPQKAFKRTQMDSGRARHRRTTVTIAKKANVNWLMTKNQLSVFEAFFDYELCGGVRFFKITLANGHGLVCVKARFIEPSEPYIVEKHGPYWIIAASLETFEMPTYDQSSYAIFKSVDKSNLQKASSIIHDAITNLNINW